jgi:hypothetical protein
LFLIIVQHPQGVYPPKVITSPSRRGACGHKYRYLDKYSFVKRTGQLPDFDTDLKVSFRRNLPFDGKEDAVKRKRFSVWQIVAVLKQAEMGTLREWCRRQERGEHISEEEAGSFKDPPDAVSRVREALHTETEEGHSAPIRPDSIEQSRRRPPRHRLEAAATKAPVRSRLAARPVPTGLA